jgi:hypothetical protein
MRYKADIGQALPMDLCLHFSVRRETNRRGLRDDDASKSWNSSHPSRGPWASNPPGCFYPPAH